MKGAVVWGSLAVGGSYLFGLGWLSAPVEVPLWGLLLLTFVPTRELTETIREPFKRIQKESA